MSLHNSYMIVISAIFAAVFAIIIHSLIRHRQACARTAAKFTGTSGARQWVWALVPLAILAGINASLIGAAGDVQPKAGGQQHAQR
jgi:cytochrome c oxidase subunit 2